jgi:hypothetical protein
LGSIAKALHTTPAYLMGWEAKEEPADNDELQVEANEIFASLSVEKQNQVLSFLRFLKGEDNQ